MTNCQPPSQLTSHVPLRLRIRLLGGFSILAGAQPLSTASWRLRRATAVIKLLALTPGYRLHREQVMETLWPELDPEAQANNLRQALHHARAYLEAGGLPRRLVLTREAETLVLAPPDALWVDARAFDLAVAEAWRRFTAERAEAALVLYGGELLPDDRYDDWIEERRGSLRASFLALLTRLAQFQLERGAFTEAIGVLQRLVREEPGSEAAHVWLIRAYLAIDQPEAALAQYDRLVLALAGDDLVPDPVTIALVQELPSNRPPLSLASFTDHGIGSPPALAGDLVGRDRELAELRQLLATERLVTLTGAGGVGKTRLALEAAGLAAYACRSDSAFVDLAPLRDPKLVPSAVASALKVRPLSGYSILESLQLQLSRRRILLLIDNLEHLLPAAAFIANLRDTLPQATILATSRVRLGLPGEREFRVEPLATSAPGVSTVEGELAPAVDLFVRRAREAQPGFVYDADNAPAVAAICARLDGMPLALELAAARIPLLSPDALLDRLERPLALLADARHSARPVRQQTMRAAINWSVELLAPEDQRLFRHLSVFAGGWTLEAAEAIAEPGQVERTLDGLAELHAQHLLTRRERSGEVRFAMLEPIRELAAEQLDAGGETAEARDRHASWFVRLAERAAPHLEQADQAAWLARLDADDDNLRAALQWLAERGRAEPGLRLVNALRLHWFMRGRVVEGCDWTLALAALPESSRHPALQAGALVAAGFFARECGDYERAWSASRDALTLAHRLDERHLAADAMANLGFVALQRGDFADARDLLTQILMTYRATDNQQGMADALSLLGLTLQRLGDAASARARIEESIAIWTRLDDRQALTVAYPWLGHVLLARGDLLGAYDQYARALEIARELDFEWGSVFALDGLAQVAHDCGDHELALRLLAAAHEFRRRHGIQPHPVDQQRSDELLALLTPLLGPETVEQAFQTNSHASPAELAEALRASLLPVLREPPGSRSR